MPKKPANRSDGRYEIKRTIPAEYSADGKPFRKSFYSSISKQDCINQYNAYLLDLGRNPMSEVQFPSDNTNFTEWANTWLVTYKKGNVKGNTYSETYERTVNNYLIPHFGERDIKDIKPIDIQTFMNDMAQKFSDSTLSKIQLCLNGMFDIAADNGLIQKNPAKKINAKSEIKKEEKRTYTQEQYDTIISFMQSHPEGHMIRLMLEVGLRCSEFCGLQYGDIDFDTHTLHAQRTCTRVKYKPFISNIMKNNPSHRDLPISSNICNQLAEAYKGHEKSDYICTGTKLPVTPEYFSKVKYKNLMTDLTTAYPSIPKLTPHELRHTCGTLLYTNSKDIYAVSKYLGHANINITVKLYVHDSADLLREHLGIV